MIDSMQSAPARPVTLHTYGITTRELFTSACWGLLLLVCVLEAAVEALLA
jgi:hypothetical protein